MEIFKPKRTNVKSQLTRFLNYLDSEELELNISTLRIRLEKAEPLFDKYDEIQSEIELLADGNQIELEAQARNQETFENNYFKAIAKARGIIQRITYQEHRDQ